MAYIDRIVIHNFKSFHHASISLKNGFNCIVGPNGSGKSSIIDALFFALGEQSLKRLRITSASQLINENSKKGDHTYVKVVFGGEAAIEVARIIKEGKIAYTLNGKHVTRQEIVNVLMEKGCEINETNTIAQGEIAVLQNLTAKGRRELIDVAAGIQEFNLKKEDALKELDKVEVRLANARSILNERMGFLNELKAEKEQAERYTALANEVKQINYTILQRRQKVLEKEYDKAVTEYNSARQAKDELAKALAEVNAKINDLSLERDGISKKLNERLAGGSGKGRLDEISRELSILESKQNGIIHDMENANARIQSIKAEILQIEPKIESNAKAMEAIGGISEEEADAGIGSGELEALSREYNALEKSLEEKKQKLDSLVSDHSSMLYELNTAEKEIERLASEIDANSIASTNLKNSYAYDMQALQEIEKQKRAILESMHAYDANERSIKGEIERLQAESINIREQLAMSKSGSDKIAEFLSSNAVKGFYGPASDLCTYDDKYAIAIAAAGGNRLNYFVVDSVDVADSCIKALKQMNLGRASFIPIKEIQNAHESGVNAQKIIDFVRFDPKFEKVFRYAFSDTFLVSGIDEAKKLGIGKARYVTLDGELFEPSGVVSGGSMKAMASASLLKQKLAQASNDIETLSNSLAGVMHEREEQQNKLAELEAKAIKLNVECNYANGNIEKASNAIEESKKNLEALQAKKDKLLQLDEKISMEKGALAKELEEDKKRSVALYDKLTNSIIGKDDSKAKDERKRRSEARVKLAELKKENEMLSLRSSDLKKQLHEEEEKIQLFNEKKAEIALSIASYEKDKKAVEEEIMKYDQQTKGIYAELEGISHTLSEHETERGKLLAGMDKYSRNIMELESTKAQLEVRLGDIKAELSSSDKAEELAFSDSELQTMLSKDKNELQSIGNINLKAPELYAEKKKDVDAAQGKLDVLQNEKASIIDMIEQIEARKHYVFNDTLSKVNKNFNDLYKRVWPGSAELVLSDPKDVSNSGLYIDVKIDEKDKTFNRFSGGERAFMTIMLLFSIQMQNPLSFYVFDEIDAALDKENSKNLSVLIKEMSKHSQFLVVTHNDLLLTHADVCLGVVRQDGFSNVVGVVLENGDSMKVQSAANA